MGNSKHIKLMKEIAPSIFLVLALGILFIGLLISSDWMWRNQIRRNVPIYDNLMQVRIYLTKGQLLLERMLSGDKSIRIEDIWPYYKRSEIALRDCMNGRSTIIQLAGVLPKDNEILSQLGQLEGTLKRSRELSLARWKTRGAEESINILDEHTLFYRLESTIDAINYRILGNIGKMMNDQKKAHSVTIVLWLLILSVVCGTIFFIGKKRKRAEIALQKAHNELEQRVKKRTIQLKNVNEQLSLEIEERKQAEKVMLESEVRFRRIYDSNMIAIAYWDLAGGITDANDAFLDMVGYTSQELKSGMVNWSAMTPPECANLDKKGLQEIKEKGVCTPFEKEYIKKDGQRVPVLIGGASLMGEGQVDICYAIDISERKLAEEMFQRERDKAKTYLDVAGVILVVINADQTVALINKKGCEVLGYEESEIVGEKWFDNFLTERDRERTKAAFSRLIGGDIEPTEYYENPVLTKNNIERLIAWHNSVLRNSAGEIVAILSSGEDVTERKQAEEDLLHLNKTLEQKVAERTELAENRARQLQILLSDLILTEERERRRISDLLHDDLQQLLVAVKMRLENLSAHVKTDDQNNFQRIQDMVQESLRKSRSLTVELSPPVLKIHGLVPALEWLANYIQQTHDLQVELQLDPRVVITREDIKILLFQCARELLLNAIKHARVSSVHLSVTADDSNRVCIAVSDKGVGFDPDKNVNNRNVGFGLVRIRERLALLDGCLEVDSTLRKGTTCTLIAPLKEDELQQIEERIIPIKTDSISCRNGPPICVLLVDDHAMMREGLASLLKNQSDIEIVAEAANGEEAVALAREWRPDVILMDNSMPKLSGIEATQIINSEFPYICTIGLSMYDDSEIESNMLAAGAVAYLTKDGSSEVLLATIRDHGSKKKEKE